MTATFEPRLLSPDSFTTRAAVNVIIISIPGARRLSMTVHACGCCGASTNFASNKACLIIKMEEITTDLILETQTVGCTYYFECLDCLLLYILIVWFYIIRMFYVMPT